MRTIRVREDDANGFIRAVGRLKKFYQMLDTRTQNSMRYIFKVCRKLKNQK